MIINPLNTCFIDLNLLWSLDIRSVFSDCSHGFGQASASKIDSCYFNRTLFQMIFVDVPEMRCTFIYLGSVKMTCFWNTHDVNFKWF